MAAFNPALRYLLANEGGFVFDPLDPGGATNCGISVSSLSIWKGRPCTIDEVRTLEKLEVASIYFHAYWRPLGGVELEKDTIGTALLDMGSLFGVATAIFAAQVALNFLEKRVRVDGRMGPRTLMGLDQVDVAEFLDQFTNGLEHRITALVVRNPKLAKFQKGWRARVSRLDTLEKGMIYGISG